MDKYNHWLGKLFGKIFNNGNPYAITLGQTTYYSCPSTDVSPRWHKHEDEHKRQWDRDGKAKFLVRYVWFLVIKSYITNPYEIEARKAESGLKRVT